MCIEHQVDGVVVASLTLLCKTAAVASPMLLSTVAECRTIAVQLLVDSLRVMGASGSVVVPGWPISPTLTVLGANGVYGKAGGRLPQAAFGWSATPPGVKGVLHKFCADAACSAASCTLLVGPSKQCLNRAFSSR